MDFFFKTIDFFFTHNLGTWSTLAIVTAIIIGAPLITFFQNKISTPPTINSNMGYHQKKYNQSIYEIMYFNFIFAFGICLFSTFFLVLKSDKRINDVWSVTKYYSLSIFILVIISVAIFSFIYFSLYRNRKKKKRGIRYNNITALKFNAFWRSFSIIFFIVILLFLYSSFFLNSLIDWLVFTRKNTPENYLSTLSLLYFVFTMVLSLSASYIISKELYKEVLIHEFRTFIISLKEKAYFKDKNLDEKTLLLVKLNIIRTNTHYKKLLSLSGSSKVAFFIPTKTRLSLLKLEKMKNKKKE